MNTKNLSLLIVQGSVNAFGDAFARATKEIPMMSASAMAPGMSASTGGAPAPADAQNLQVTHSFACLLFYKIMLGSLIAVRYKLEHARA